ncbi:hypothetical protein D3C86_1350920 [compost metagenome]
MGPFGVGMCRNRVGVTQKPFKSFVGIDHGLGGLKVVGGIVCEVEGKKGRQGEFERAVVHGSVRPFLQIVDHARQIAFI